MADFVYDQFLLGIAELDGMACLCAAINGDYTPNPADTTAVLLGDAFLGAAPAELTVTLTGGTVQVTCPDDEVTIALSGTDVQGYLWVTDDYRMISWHDVVGTPTDPVTVSFTPIIEGDQT